MESGVIDCGPATTWSGTMPALWNSSYQDQVTEKTSSFSRVYDKPPVVHLSIEYIQSNKINVFGNLYHSVELVQVDEKKFTLRCRSDSDRIAALTVSWVSVPQ